MNFKKEMVEQAVKWILNYTSNVVDKVLPDNPDEKNMEIIQNTTLGAYGLAKGWGKAIVEDTDNPYDDIMMKETIESCENTAKRFNFSLNAETY